MSATADPLIRSCEAALRSINVSEVVIRSLYWKLWVNNPQDLLKDASQPSILDLATDLDATELH